MTRTPEQEAFVDEMMHKKPREVWQELWDARKKLAEHAATPDLYRYRSMDYKTVYPEGEWLPLPVEGSDVPHEYMVHEGTTYIRAVEEGPLFPEFYPIPWTYENPPSIKGQQIDHVVFDETHFFRDSWTALKIGDEVTIKEEKGTYRTKVVHVDERDDGVYVTFEDGTVFEPPIKFFKEEFDIDFNGYTPAVYTTPLIKPEKPVEIKKDAEEPKSNLQIRIDGKWRPVEARDLPLLGLVDQLRSTQVPPTLTVKEVYESVRDNLTSMETHKKKRKVPKVKPLKGGTDFTRD